MIIDEDGYREFPQLSAAHAMGTLEGALRLASYDARSIYYFALFNRLWNILVRTYPWHREPIPVDFDIYRTTFTDERNALIDIVINNFRDANPTLAASIEELAHTFIEPGQYQDPNEPLLELEDIFTDPFSGERKAKEVYATAARTLTENDERYRSFSQMLTRGMTEADTAFATVPADLNPLDKLIFMDDLLARKVDAMLRPDVDDKTRRKQPIHCWIMALHTLIRSRDYGLISHRYNMPPIYIGSSRFDNPEIAAYRIIQEELTTAFNYLDATTAFCFRIKSAMGETKLIPHHERLLKFLSCGNMLTQAEITKLLKTSHPVAANVIATLENCGLLVTNLMSRRGPKWITGNAVNVTRYQDNYDLHHPHQPFLNYDLAD